MKKLVLIFTLLFFLILFEAGKADVFFWENTTNASIGSDIAWAVATDNFNNIIVGGQDYIGPIATPNSDYAWKIIKFDSNGQFLWQNISNTSVGSEFLYGIAVDHDNNITAVGYEFVTGTDNKWKIMKFNSSGNLLWMNNTINPVTGSNTRDSVKDVAVDHDNNITIVGYEALSSSDYRWAILKFYPNGSLIWNRSDINPTTGSDQPQGVAIDSDNNITVVGYQLVSSPNYKWRIIKFDPNGNIIWDRDFNPNTGGRNQATDVAVGPDNNITVVGYSFVATGDYNWTIMKLYPNLTTIWQRLDINPSTGDDKLQGVAVDNLNRITVVGYQWVPGGLGTNYKWLIMKFNSSGDTIWVNDTIDPNTTDFDEAKAVAKDNNNNIIVVGSDLVPNSGPSNNEWRIMGFTTDCGDGFYGPWIEECDYKAPNKDAPCPAYAYCNTTCNCYDFRPEMEQCRYYDYCNQGLNESDATKSCCEQKPWGSGVEAACCLFGGAPSACIIGSTLNPNAVVTYEYCWNKDYSSNLENLTDICVDMFSMRNWPRTCPEF